VNEDCDHDWVAIDEADGVAYLECTKCHEEEQEAMSATAHDAWLWARNGPHG